MNKKIVLGNTEFVSIPDLNIPIMKARIDSGAASSALHAFNLKILTKGDKKIISFYVYPIKNNRLVKMQCSAELAGWKYIRSSNGLIENRPFIIASIKIGEDVCHGVEITLTNRDCMGHRMLVGRDSLQPGMLVDPSRDFVITGGLEETYQESSCEKLAPLNIALLASNPTLYSNKRIMEAGAALGHNMKFLNIKKCSIEIKHLESTIRYKGLSRADIESIDAVIPRIKPRLTFYGCSLVRQFQTMGKFCLNDAHAITHSRDKLKSLQILASRRIPMPATSFGTYSQSGKSLINSVGGAPVIIKLLEGTQGKGVILVESERGAESVISAFNSANTDILVQEFVSESRGQDIRCFVVDGRVVGSMLRQASVESEFRANFHLGGTVAPITITSTERKIAITAAKVLGLPIAGVDIIRSKKGPMVLEVNSSPGLEGIERSTGKDIAKEMIRCLERNCYGTKTKKESL